MSSIPRYLIIRAKQGIQSDGTIIMTKGEKYIIPRGWIGDKFRKEMVSIVDAKIEDYWNPFNVNIKLDKRKLLIQRASGLGDMVFLSPVIKYIKDHNPEASITVACGLSFKQMFKAIPNVDKVLTIPLHLDSLKNYDYHLSFQDADVESDENVYDLLYKGIGVNPQEVSDLYKRPYLKEIPKALIPHKKVVGIQPFSGAKIRDLPQGMVVDLIDKFNKRGYHVLLIAHPKEHRLIELRNLVKNMDASCTFEHIKGDPEIYEVCKVVTNCDWIITSDSSFAHIGPGLGVKTISVYGPFSARSRTFYYKNSWSLDTRPNCRCKRHTTGICDHGIYPSPCMQVSTSYIFDIIDSNLK